MNTCTPPATGCCICAAPLPAPGATFGALAYPMCCSCWLGHGYWLDEMLATAHSMARCVEVGDKDAAFDLRMAADEFFDAAREIAEARPECRSRVRALAEEILMRSGLRLADEREDAA